MIDLFHSFRVPHPAFLESYGTRVPTNNATIEGQEEKNAI
jgi:hypothetical protein